MSKKVKSTLGEITLSIFDGKHGDCKDHPHSGCYFISVKDLQEYGIDYSQAREIDPVDFQQNYTRTNLENGDTLYANTGDTIGKSLYIKNNPFAKRTSFQKSVAVLKPNTEHVEPRYLYYLLKYETPRLRKAATGSGQKNLLLSTMRNFEVSIHDRFTQRKIVETLSCIDDRIQCNYEVNDNLQQQLRLMYDYWFNQFDFPNEEGKPYRASGGKMQYSFRLKRDIPEGWTEESVISNSISVPIKPGVERFSTKSYLATADVNGTRLSSGSLIDYETREGRANMQPTVSSVWFAKMKNSIKHLFLNREMKQLIDSTILSTGFCGLQCTEKSFEYISAFIEHSYFEDVKNILAHGATQESVNNDDLLGLGMLVPTSEVLELFHAKAKPLYAQISRNICENQKLTEIRDWLLPMLMNGQATISD